MPPVIKKLTYQDGVLTVEVHDVTVPEVATLLDLFNASPAPVSVPVASSAPVLSQPAPVIEARSQPIEPLQADPRPQDPPVSEADSQPLPVAPQVASPVAPPPEGVAPPVKPEPATLRDLLHDLKEAGFSTADALVEECVRLRATSPMLQAVRDLEGRVRRNAVAILGIQAA